MKDAPSLSRRDLLMGRKAGPPAPSAGARIGEGCLTSRGVACMSCQDACPSGAIRFRLAPGGARPHVEAGCTACGACAPVCPAAAITVTPPGEAAHA